MSITCAQTCVDLYSACISTCSTDQACIQNCGREQIDCESRCPDPQCDVVALGPVDQMNVYRNSYWSKYEGKTSVGHWKGYCYIYLPEEKRFDQVFLFDGINIGTTWNEERSLDNIDQTCDWCYEKRSREISAYRDPVTGQFLNSWENTLTGKVNEIRHVLNDPVNYKGGGWVPDLVHSKNDKNFFYSKSHVFLNYPNYLAGDEYDAYSGYDTYYAAELYSSFSDGCEARINGTSISPDIPRSDSWSRISQFLPWMEVGKGSEYWDTGYLLTHAFSQRLNRQYEEIPNDLLVWIAQYEQKYLNYPHTYETPNDTTWNVVKKLIDERRANGEPDFQPQPNGPSPPPLDNSLPQEILDYLSGPVEIPFMKGEITNYNYPENFVTLFQPESYSSLTAVLNNDKLDITFTLTSNYVKEIWNNPWTNEDIIPPTDDEAIQIIEQSVPLNQVIYRTDVTLEGYSVLVIDLFDEVANRVLFFDLFLKTDASGQIETGFNPFGAIAMYGRPYNWMGLDETWRGIDLTVETYIF